MKYDRILDNGEVTSYISKDKRVEIKAIYGSLSSNRRTYSLYIDGKNVDGYLTLKEAKQSAEYLINK